MSTIIVVLKYEHKILMLIYAHINEVTNFPLVLAGTNGKRKRDEESSESEEDETEVKTPKNKKATTTPQTFPKANKKVRLAKKGSLVLSLSCQ